MPTKGRVVIVYDGRNWPVVKCGGVYVAEDDKTKHVTKKIISQAVGADDRKIKTSKYTLAVGSSFGHVHTFLKDSDHVLKTLDKTVAEDKCLMLIRKPKSASKQMLKAHSWANLNTADAHLRQQDGTLTMDPYKHLKNRGRRKQTDLSLLPEDPTRWQYHPKQKQPYSGSTSTYQQSCSKGLSSVSEYDETQSDVLPWKHEALVSNLPQSCPFDKPPPQRTPERVKSQSNNELYTDNYRSEIINNLANRNPANQRSHGPAPEVPKQTTVNESNVCSDNSPKDNKHTQQNGDKNNNRPDLITSVTGNKPEPQVPTSQGKMADTVAVDTRVKHDSGCHSDLRISSDEMYSLGFKSSADKSVTNGNLNQAPTGKNSRGLNPQGHRNDNNRPISSNKARNETVDSSRQNGYTSKTSQSFTSPGFVKGVPNVRADRGAIRSDSKNRNVNVKGQHNGCSLNSKSVSYNGRQVTKSNSRNDPIYAVPKKPPRTFAEENSVEKHENNAADVNQNQASTESDEAVTRSCSVGDLTAGCTFSLVGQKKSGSVQVLPTSEFTGSQMTKHFRKYREIKHENKHNSLPFQGKSGNIDSDMRAKLGSLSIHRNENSKGDNSPLSKGGNLSKLSHYCSLQHLPNAGSNNEYNRHVLPTRTHQKTPMKPRRSLPQVPKDSTDIDERKKHYSDIVKMRMTLSSRSSNSPASGTNFSGSRQEMIRETPSDREVSELLQEHTATDFAWVSSAAVNTKCNKISNHGNNGNYGNVLMSDAYYDNTDSHKIKQFDSFGSHDQNSLGRPSASGQSESGYHTLTSQSTVDSGYITNDPDTEIFSTSNYAKTLKQSAHNLYSSNSKLFTKPSKGTNPQAPVLMGENSTTTSSVKPVPQPKSGYFSTQPKLDNHVTENPKDCHTRNWVEQHPAVYTSDIPTSEPVSVTHNTHTARFDAGSDPKQLKDKQVTQNGKSGTSEMNKSATLSHRSSELTMKEIAKLNSDARQLKPKGKSVSMSYGLNLIEQNLTSQTGSSYFSKSRPQFTGSLKDLAQSEKYLVPVESLKTGSSEIVASLQESWKSQAGIRSESSLKVLGKPSLFQLLQNYHLYPVRLKILENFKLMEQIRLVECEVVLPSPWSSKSDSPTLMSPKGSYAKLGGPNSAFTPVFSGSTTISSVAMVAVVEVANVMTEVFEAGQINKGDLIVEVNERLMMGEDLSVLTKNLQSCQGELLLTVARDKARDPSLKLNATNSADEVHKLEAKIAQLTKQLEKRDRTLKQLNTLLPWKKAGEDGKTRNNHDLDIICNLSDDEFIV